MCCTQLVTSDHSSDVTGVEIAGALKNVLAIAAGIVDGMQLGNNSMAALVSQGCSEIRWLATKVANSVYFCNRLHRKWEETHHNDYCIFFILLSCLCEDGCKANNHNRLVRNRGHNAHVLRQSFKKQNSWSQVRVRGDIR